MSTADVVRLVAGLGLILVMAHGFGRLAALLRQPPVVGEILAGVLLGPSCLGLVAPRAEAYLLPSGGPVADGLNACYQLGQLLLIFLAGAELRIAATKRELSTGARIALGGLLVPFAVGVGLALADGKRFAGPSATAATTPLIVGLAVAVAAIPVIARIMDDLGVSGTRFGRLVLMVAVVEDAVLYIVLAVALGLAKGAGGVFGLWQAHGSSAPIPTAVYYTVVSVLFLGVCLRWGPGLYRRLATGRANLPAARSAVGFRLAFLCAMVVLCAVLGVNPVFGALTAGACVARGDEGAADPGTAAASAQAWEATKQLSTALFIPLFFLGVGRQVNLVHGFDPWFLCWFLLLATGAKLLGVWPAARLAGESPRVAGLLALALNARGTVGLILAGTAYQDGLINQQFFTVLVLVSVLTSQLAGCVLGLPGQRRAVIAAADPMPAAPSPRPAVAAVR
ncbi:MAG TPA: cation:proton antiporter [Actinospica sp.]|jgi:Kef-type K+ transport system membrane component KefB|nr:cation:proton antiporter [Actinospica sp.]